MVLLVVALYTGKQPQTQDSLPTDTNGPGALVLRILVSVLIAIGINLAIAFGTLLFLVITGIVL